MDFCYLYWGMLELHSKAEKQREIHMALPTMQRNTQDGVVLLWNRIVDAIILDRAPYLILQI